MTTNLETLAAKVAAGQASQQDMDRLGVRVVQEIKSCPDLLQVRARGSSQLSHNADTRTISYLVSDESVDRMGDIISVKGWDLAQYKKNPVVLWAHDGRTVPPIGRSNNVRRRYGPKRLTADIEFADAETHEFADTIYRLASKGFIRATSVGFLPKETAELDEKERTKLGLGAYGSFYSASELMEISVVAVPANPSALEDGVKSLIDGGHLDKAMAARFLDAYPKDEPTALERFRESCRSFVDFGAVVIHAKAGPEADAVEVEASTDDADVPMEERMAKPPHKTAKAPMDQGWDAADVWKKINAEYEGEGKADRYWDIAAFRVHDGDPEAQSTYKFPHHDADGKVVWHGVAAAMAALNGARGGATGLSQKDKEGIHAHLAAHYQQFEEEAPALRAGDAYEADDDEDEFTAHTLFMHAFGYLVEQQAEHTKATRQLVDALSDLTQRLHAPDPSGNHGGDQPDAVLPDAGGKNVDDLEEILETSFRGFAATLRRAILTNTPKTQNGNNSNV